MKPSLNITMLQDVARALEELLEEVVFVGGATTALYIDDASAPAPTLTDDVDCVVKVATLRDYYKLESRLRSKGFSDPIPDPDDPHPICRKIYQGIKVDIMPTEEKILGFSNEWYPAAIEKKIETRLPNGQTIYIFNVVYFLATKLKAYHSRGRGEDIRNSQDIEDICSVLDGCSYIEKELTMSAADVKKFLQSSFKKLLKDEHLFEEAAHGFIRSGGDPIGRATALIRRVKKIL